MGNVVISSRRVDRRIGTLCRNLCDHFLQYSPLYVLAALGMRLGTPRPAHLIAQRTALQDKLEAAPFGPPITQPIPSSCTESELRSKSRRMVSAGSAFRPPLAQLKRFPELQSIEAITLEEAERDHIRKTLPVGLSPVPMVRRIVSESSAPRCTSACKSSASHAPPRIPFRWHSRVGVTRERILN
jgi:hypothetical protein